MSGELKEAINKLASKPGEQYSIPCIVTAVDIDQRTCDVAPINGDAAVYGVKLQSNINLTIGCVLVPKVDSHVIIAWLNKETAYVALTGEIEKTIVTIENVEITHSSSGISINSSSTTLREQIDALVALMDGILTTLENFQLNTTGAPGPTIGVMPQVLTDIAMHRASLMQFSNDINTIIAE